MVRRQIDKEDLKYLSTVVAAHPDIYRISIPHSANSENIWSHNYDDVEPNRIYVKIDDDILFIQVRRALELGFLSYPTSG